MKKVELEEAKQHLSEYLARQEMRPTISRIKILEYIFERRYPFSADTLYEELKTRFHVSRATVYNTLQLFLDCQIIIKYHLNCNSSICYEISRTLNDTTHHIFTCTSCGTTQNHIDRELSRIIQTRIYRGFSQTHHVLTIYGLCSKCARELKKTKLEKS